MPYSAADALEGAAGYAVAAPLLFATVVVTAVVGAVLALLVQTSVSTYLRYYALLVLGDLSPEYDLLETVRREGDDDDERGGEGGSATGSAVGDDVEEWPP